MDLGAAHGGFVQILLEEGAERIYAIDVGYGILEYSLRKNERVIVLERKNLRFLHKSWFLAKDISQTKESEVQASSLFITCDVSFLSSRTVLEVLARFSQENQIPLEAMILIKPQFEASQKTQKGIIHNPQTRQKLIDSVREKAESLDFSVHGIREAIPAGRKGNLEYMMYLNSVPYTEAKGSPTQ